MAVISAGTFLYAPFPLKAQPTLHGRRQACQGEDGGAICFFRRPGVLIVKRCATFVVAYHTLR